jgi:non-heme chloroperoxidase
MKKFLLGSLLCLCLASLPSCRKYHHPGENCKGACQSYQTKFIKGSTNNTLEVLDWGGKGQPILFLTGLGNTAHVFVDFAPKFTDKFHVYVMSRRGYGASEQTANGYGVDTLANDILAVTKALQLNKVILIGHSIAGDEISKFASSYPDRVDKVIYLDAAYDRTNLDSLNSHMPAFPEPTTQDLSSLESIKNFRAKTEGISIPDEELKNQIVFSSDGSFQKLVTPEFIPALILKGVERPDYKNITCPALAIYAISGSVNQLFPFYPSLDAENKKRADAYFRFYSNFAEEQGETFKKEVKNGTVTVIKGGHHYVFISNPFDTEKLIREFLK